MNGGRTAPAWRRLAATLIAALLALQSTLPMIAPTAADSDTAAFWRELGVDLAGVVCRTAANGAEAPGAPAPAAPHDDHHSLLCKALCGANAPALAAAPPPAGPVIAEVALPDPAAAPLSPRRAAGAQPRAPPHRA